MAKSRELKVVITGDAAQLDRAFAKSSKDLDKFGKHADATTKRFSSGMKVAGAAAAGALVVGLKSSVSAAVEAEKSSAKLEAQLKALGISYRAHAKEIDNVIQKTSKLSGLDDEDLQDAFSNVVRATGNVNQALKDMTLVADLARARHMDVAKAGDLLAKVHAGNTGVLTRMGVAFVKSTANVDKLKAATDKATPAQVAAAKAADKHADATRALGLLQDKFSGQAKKYGETTAGAADRAQVGFENLREVVGAKLTPALAKVANKLADLANWASANPGKFKAIAITIGAVGAALGTVMVVTKVVAAVRVLRTAMIALNVSMLANPAVAITAGIVAFGAAMVIAYRKSATFRGIVVGAFQGVTKAVDVFLGGISSMLSALGHIPRFGWAKTAADAIDKAREATRGFADNLNRIPKHVDVTINIKAPKNRSTGNITATDVLGNFGHKASGGVVPGAGDGDTVPTMLTPGEFVIRKAVVQRYGPTFFAGLNGGMGSAQGQAPVRGYSAGGIVARANAIDAKHMPYVWGGGHGRTGVPLNGGFDCSGAVSAILGVSPPRVSGGFTSWGSPGPGNPMDTKVFANASHVFAVLNGKGWGTSAENPGGGPGWLSYNYRPGFTIRHISDGAGGGGNAGSSVGDPPEASESGKAQRAGSRLVNRIIGRSASVVNAATRKATAIAGVVEDADAGYGRSERFFGQVLGGQPGAFGDEDLGTAAGRGQRVSELTELRKLKVQQLARLKKRMAALTKAVNAREKTLESLRRARDKAKGAKRAKITERLKTYEDRTIDLKAELAALGGSISDTRLDIGDLDKDIQDVQSTPDTAADGGDAGPSTTDQVSAALAHVDALERAGDLSPADAQTQRIGILQSAIAGGFGALTADETLSLRGDLRDATSALTQATVDNTSALKDLKASIDAQIQFANGVAAVTSAEAVRVVADVLSGQYGQRVAARSSLPGSGALSRL